MEIIKVVDINYPFCHDEDVFVIRSDNMLQVIDNWRTADYRLWLHDEYYKFISFGAIYDSESSFVIRFHDDNNNLTFEWRNKKAKKYYLMETTMRTTLEAN